MHTNYQVGDRVVYTRDKYTCRPSAGVKGLSAERKGESYRYQVLKYWVVCGVHAGGRIEVCTRRGHLHTVLAADERLRHATLLERIFKRRYFPTSEQLPVTSPKFRQARNRPPARRYVH